MWNNKVSKRILPRNVQLSGFLILGICAVYTLALIFVVSLIETAIVTLRYILHGKNDLKIVIYLYKLILITCFITSELFCNSEH